MPKIQTEIKVRGENAVNVTDNVAVNVAKRLAILRPYLEGEIPLTQVASTAGIPLRTARRWVACFRKGGPAALNRKTRSDSGERRLAKELVTLIEGQALSTPRLSIATIHRRVSTIAAAQGWTIPSYASVYEIVSHLSPAMITLVHEGECAFRDRYELVHRMNWYIGIGPKVPTSDGKPTIRNSTSRFWMPIER